MKKTISILLTVVLLVSIVNFGSFNVNAECSKHVYTNACDTLCNECGSQRVFITHDYDDCFIGREDNVEYLRNWQKTVNNTGMYAIQPVLDSQYFTHHYLIVIDANGGEVKFNNQANGWPLVKGESYTLTLSCLYDDVELERIDFNLVKLGDALYPDTNPFDWYYDAVCYVTGAGIMSGYSNGNFGTSDSIQRQDFLVMLARFDGVDLDTYSAIETNFPDVPEDSYFEAAVNWGAQNNIVRGYEGGKFGVGDNVTREQLVTFLYRYAQYKNIDVNVDDGAKDNFAAQYIDFGKVSEFASKEMVWALENGVISGKNATTLAPQGNAQRCEVAKIMYNNFKNNILPVIKYCFHTYSEATCTAPKTCSKCQKTIGFPSSHTYDEANCVTLKSCVNCGRTSGTYGDHSFVEATCTEPETCIYCGGVRGEKRGHTYVAGECVNLNSGEICNHFKDDYCPKLFFTGDMSKITDPAQTSKKIECDINFEYRSANQVVNGAAKIKIQGSSSTKYAKKNYTINFYEDSNYSNKKKIDVGWGKQSKYCLKANWIDKTHSRNIVSARIASKVQAKYSLFTVAPHNGTIDGFPVEIYINGEFHGLYTMNIPKDEWMFGMDKNNPNHIVICGENWNDPVLFKSVPTDLEDWTVEAGPEDDATLEKVQRLVDFVLNSSDEEFKENFEQYLNLDSTLNYFVMMSYFWTPDNTGKNMLLATYDGNVWYPTMYDLDTTWGTHWNGGSTYDYSKGYVNGSNSNLWSKFERCYKKEIAERYFELREDILDPENVMAEFNNFQSSIPQEVLDRETQKWNTADNPIPGYPLTQIQHYLDTVIPRLDARYEAWL
ncbi:MAG: CotH kinase family protein [Clostridia bacterium]|nr:CotH kinase family protein [Clostridia bacterium]